MKNIALSFSALLFFSAPAWPLGMDIGEEPAVEQAGWPKGAVELANDPHRVSGYWVNQSNVFFFAGDTAAFNAFLARDAALAGEATPHVLTIKPGPGATTKLSGKEPKIHYDWSLEITLAGWDAEQRYNPDPKFAPFQMIVQIVLATGGAVALDGVVLPGNVGLKTKASEDIEAWVMRQRVQRFEAAVKAKTAASEGK